MNLLAISLRWFSACAACLLLAACSSASHPSAQSSNPSQADKEMADVAPIVRPYKQQQVVTGVAIEGPALVISTDSEKWSELDDSADESLKAALLARWGKSWTRDHPHQHAHISVIFRNYYGQEITSVAKSV
ncbi:MAG: hypothetical protein NVSMB31_12790 [Vulcanimicrobiaceae bacterium]